MITGSPAHDIVIWACRALAAASLAWHAARWLRAPRPRALPAAFGLTCGVTIGLALSAGLVYVWLSGDMAGPVGEWLFGPTFGALLPLYRRLPDAVTVPWDPGGHPLFWVAWLLLNALYLGLPLWALYVALGWLVSRLVRRNAWPWLTTRCSRRALFKVMDAPAAERGR